MPCEERRGSCRNFARGPRTHGKTANRAVVAADYSVFIPVCLPWGIILSASEAPEKKKVLSRYRGLCLLLAERCCEMRSARRANSQHAGLARSEQVWLLRLGSAPLRGCSATGRGLRPASLTSRLVRTRIGRPKSRGAKLRDAASSARSPKLPSVCHVRGDQ